MGLPEPVGEVAEGGGVGQQQKPLLQGPEAASPSQGLHIPRSPAAVGSFFTTSGYRTLHEFRSQWNYFRILVNRKLGVFHKLSISAVWWAEPQLGVSNGCREAPATTCQRGGWWAAPAHPAVPLRCSPHIPLPPPWVGWDGSS